MEGSGSGLRESRQKLPTSIIRLLLAEPSIARSWLEESAACSCGRAKSPAKEQSKAVVLDCAVQRHATPPAGQG